MKKDDKDVNDEEIPFFVEPETEEGQPEEDQHEGEKETPDIENLDGEDTTDEPSEDESEEKKESKSFTQEDVDRIIQNRLMAERAKFNREKELWEKQQEGVNNYNQEQERVRQELVKKAVADGLIEADDDLAKKPVAKQDIQKAYWIDRSLTKESYSADVQRLGLIASDKGYSQATINAINTSLNQILMNDNIPLDLIPAAARHKNGVDLLKKIVLDSNIKDEIALAGLTAKQGGNVDDFVSKFNELADGLDVEEKPQQKSPTKKKIEPSKREHLSPSGDSKSDDDVEIPVAKWA